MWNKFNKNTGKNNMKKQHLKGFTDIMLYTMKEWYEEEWKHC